MTSRSWLPTATLIGGFVLFWTLLLAPDFIRSDLCPVETFISGPIGNDIGIISALLILPASFALCLLIRTCSPLNSVHEQAPLFRAVKSHPVSILVVSVSGLVICGVLWGKATFSYYCVTPHGILLHSSTFGPAREFTWADVRQVDGVCWAGSRTPWQGGLNLSMDDGEEIRLPFGTGRGVHGPEKLKRNYDAIKAALRGKAYKYDTRDIRHCPKNIYPLLAYWPYERF